MFSLIFQSAILSTPAPANVGTFALLSAASTYASLRLWSGAWCQGLSLPNGDCFRIGPRHKPVPFVQVMQDKWSWLCISHGSINWGKMFSRDRGECKEFEQRLFKICELITRLNSTSLLNKYSKHTGLFTFMHFIWWSECHHLGMNVIYILLIFLVYRYAKNLIVSFLFSALLFLIILDIPSDLFNDQHFLFSFTLVISQFKPWKALLDNQSQDINISMAVVSMQVLLA